MERRRRTISDPSERRRPSGRRNWRKIAISLIGQKGGCLEAVVISTNFGDEVKRGVQVFQKAVEYAERLDAGFGENSNNAHEKPRCSMAP